MSDIATRLANLSPVKQRLLEERLKDRRQVAEPVAIVGMACRLPGAASLDAYWQLIRDGATATSEIPASRWDADAFYDPTGEAPGKMATRWGAFLQDVNQFDPLFFGITPREASRMDPQQRLLLEVAWESLEQAGLSPQGLAGSRTGVFVGIGGTDYSKVPSHYEDYLEQIDAHVGTGNALSIAANRISYIFDFHGPSFAVDTACSSALVALHCAVQSLRNRECDAALAGGVNLILSPEVTIAFSKARMLSPDGVCRPFDARANGYVRGEGCALLLIKRLTDAVRDGDNIAAVIRATAINQDGRTSGIAAPNGSSQQQVIRAALTQAGLDSERVTYLEAHGTGTPLGDPIETQALARLFPRRDVGQPPCYVTSVKANIGHTETVSGVAGLIKTVLLLKHGVIPSQVHLEELNPNITLAGSRIEIPQVNVAWPRGDEPRVAGVSSFGFGGTNAHVILEEAAAQPSGENAAERPLHILALSAKDKSALQQLAGSYAEHLEQHSTQSLADIAATANMGRSHFRHRLAVVADNALDLQPQLARVANGDQAPKKTKLGEVRSARHPKVAFVFTGQGSQYADMGRRLFETQPLVRETLTECADLLADLLDESLLSVMFPTDPAQSLLNETQYTQPALFALEYALARLWMSWGLRPDLVLGHSVGEYAAASVAGVFSLQDGLRLIAQRGRLMQQLPRDGEMAVVFAAESAVAELLSDHASSVSIAAVNGPQNTVISGRSEVVQDLLAEFERRKIRTQRLAVSHAFHSPLMEPMLKDFKQVASEVQFHPPQFPLISNLAASAEMNGALDTDYWVRHVREPVRFSAGMEALLDEQPDIILEIGPSPQLIGMARSFVEGEGLTWLPSLRKGHDDWRSMLDSLAELYVVGVNVDWQAFDRGWQRRRVSLPSYPFQRSRHWFDPGKKAKRGFAGGQGPVLHPLLGRNVPTALEQSLYESSLSSRQPPFLADHQVQGSVVVPASAFLEMALAAAEQTFGAGAHTVENFAIQQAMFLPADAQRAMQISVGTEQFRACALECYSRSVNDDSEHRWTLHARGKIQPASEETDEATPGIPGEIQRIHEQHVDVKTREEFYRLVAERELNYGKTFQVLGTSWRRPDKAIFEVELPDAVRKQLGEYHLHPALLDGCLQAAAGIVPLEADGSYSPHTYMPRWIRRLRVIRPLTEKMQIFARRTDPVENTPSPECVQCDIFLLDDDGNVLVELLGVRVQRIGNVAGPTAEQDVGQWLYQIEWQEKTLAPPTDQPPHADSLAGAWLVLSDGRGVGAALTRRLTDCGAHVLPLCWQDVDPLDGDSYRRLLDTVPAGLPLRGVVHLWSLDIPEADAQDAVPAARRLGCGSVLKLIQALARQRATNISLWLATQDAQPVPSDGPPRALHQASLWGLGRVAALEHPELGCRMIDLGREEIADELAASLIAELQAADTETQIARRGPRRYVARLVSRPSWAESAEGESPAQLTVPAGVPSRLYLAAAGSIDGLRIAPMTREAPANGEVEVAVHATGVNFSDVLKAIGLYPGITDQQVPLGIECSGVVTAVGDGVDRFRAGDAVMGVVPYGFATHALSAEYALVPKPECLDHEAAATIPITFLTAYYALCRLAHLQPEERVLIHAGAGGVGLAAIQIAQHVGAEIFATAGSEEKREFLRSFGVPHVMNSRTLDFADEILDITNRAGVDVVLNSLPGEAIDRSLSILTAYGRFLEIGKTDIYQNRMVGLSPFQDNLSYFAIDLDRMLRQRPELIRELFAEVMEGFHQGWYQALPLARFTFAETRESFRYMAQRRNIGKVVVSLADDAAHADGTAAHQEKGTYLITGGLGALGQRVAASLASRGIRHLVLLSRRPPTVDGQEAMRRLQKLGVQVCAVQGDVSQIHTLRAALDQIPAAYPPLAGVVHAAGVLDDGVLFDMSLEQLDRAMRPKIDGAWNLHLATQDAPLREFILFSSVASVLGSPGQGNYAAGNAFLDALAHHRRACGLPATAINWGPWADGGMAADGPRGAQIAARGMDLLPAELALELLQRLLRHDVTQATVMRPRWAEMFQAHRGAVPSLLIEVASAADDESSSVSLDEGLDHPFRQQLLAADESSRKSLLREYFVEQLAAIMGLDPCDVDQEQPLNTLGLDSLMAIELKNQVETRLGVVLPMARFMEGPSAASLADEVAGTVTDEQEVTVLATAEQDGQISDRFSLSYGQQALWFLYKLAPESAAYHICDAVRVRGALDLEVLRRTMQHIVDRHAAFRTTFHDAGGRPYQQVHGNWPVAVRHVEAADWQDTRLTAEIGAEAHRPFDLEEGPLVRITVFVLGEDEHVLVFCVHHIVTDFWSLVACTEEFRQVYAALAEDRECGLSPLKLDYSSFVRWQTDLLSGPKGERHWEYWREHLSGELPVLTLPTDRPRPPTQTFNGALVFRWLDAELTGQLKQLAERQGATLNMLLLAVYQLLLHRYSGQDDLIVGLPTSGRPRAEFAPLVGYFVNPVPVRVDLSGNPTFVDFLQQVRQRTLGSLEHQDYPISLLVDRLHPERDPSRSTLFQALFVMQKAQVMHEQGLTPFLMGQSGATLELAGLSFESMTLDHWVAQLDLSLAASEANGGTSLGLQYNTDLFDASTAERMLDHFQTILRDVVQWPTARVSQIDLLTESEQQQLDRWNRTETPAVSRKLVHERIEQQAGETPEAVAVVCGADHLTYRELDERANRLAHHLRTRGAAPNRRIGLCLDRGIDLVVAMQAILRAGAAYVPLDPSYPSQRLCDIAQRAGMSLIVTVEQHRPAVEQFPGQIVCLDSESAEISQMPSDSLDSAAGPDDLIYVIYTSGSTGKPKGAGVYHRGFANLMDWYIEDLQIGARDRVLVITSHGFDLTQKNFYATLMVGGQLHLSSSRVYDPQHIREEVSEDGVSLLNCTPSNFYGLVDTNADELQRLRSLRCLVLGGEAIDLNKLEAWCRQDDFGTELVNSYGPTECTDVVIYHRVDEPANHVGQPVPLGRPIRNVRAMILDQHLAPVPRGVTGELCLGGACVGGGYVDDLELTERRFVSYRSPQGTEEVVYRTGDLCRQRADGVIEFLGRSDHQVKLRGFRIELGEIEHSLLGHDAVQEAVVSVREDTPGVKQLVAYVVLGDDATTLPELKAFLRESLPEHMVPPSFVLLDAIPLTAHGKLDRRSLPAPSADASRAGAEFVAPRTEQEKMLAAIWREILNHDRVGIRDSFFDLGGDSLLSIQVVSRVGEHGWHCTPAQVFQYQTLSELAAALVRRSRDAADQEMVSGDVPLTPIQRWFFDLRRETPAHFNQSLLLNVPSGLRPDCLEKAVAALLAHHDVLRTRFRLQAADNWQQLIIPIEGGPPLETCDLSSLPKREQSAAIERRCGQVQASLDLDAGPLLRVVHFELGGQGPGRLLLTLHHLVVNPYSWRVLLDDLLTAYQQAVRGEPIRLPPKTDSFQQWSRRLVEFATSVEWRTELAYWASVLQGVDADLPTAHLSGENTVDSADTLTVTLSAADTRRYLDLPSDSSDAPLAYLLTAFAVAYQTWAARPILVDIEWHGRAGLIDDMDVSRTVGWFVAMYPMLLNLEGDVDPTAAFLQVRDQLAAVPRRGAGYGVLRYLRPHLFQEMVGDHKPAEVRFNYLGQLELASQGAFELEMAAENRGDEQAANAARPHELEIDAHIRGGLLQVDWKFSRNRQDPESMQQLTGHFLEALQMLLDKANR